MACVFPKMVSSQKRRRQCRHARLPAIRGGATMAARKRPYTEMTITKTTAHGDQLSLRSLNGRWMTTNDHLGRIIQIESLQTDAEHYSATMRRDPNHFILPKRTPGNTQRPYAESKPVMTSPNGCWTTISDRTKRAISLGLPKHMDSEAGAIIAKQKGGSMQTRIRLDMTHIITCHVHSMRTSHNNGQLSCELVARYEPITISPN